MRYVIAALLSAALIWLIPQSTPVNNSTVVRVKARTVQAASPEKVAEVKSSAPTEQKTIVEPATVATQVVTQPPVPSTHESLMNQAGITPEDYGAADYIVRHESSWRTYVSEPTTGAYGLCQSLPAAKMASAGSDWRTNPVTQLRWCNTYAADYGGWQAAYRFWNCIGSCYSGRTHTIVAKKATWW
jgi:hypothetical protein